MGSENLLRSSRTGELFLIDWEAWAPDAPVQTDRLGFWLGTNEKRIRRARRAEICRAFDRDFVARRAIDPDDATMALAFLVARGFAPAVRVALAMGAPPA
jgi:hypothetical protein